VWLNRGTSPRTTTSFFQAPSATGNRHPPPNARLSCRSRLQGCYCTDQSATDLRLLRGLHWRENGCRSPKRDPRESGLFLGTV